MAFHLNSTSKTLRLKIAVYHFSAIEWKVQSRSGRKNDAKNQIYKTNIVAPPIIKRSFHFIGIGVHNAILRKFVLEMMFVVMMTMMMVVVMKKDIEDDDEDDNNNNNDNNNMMRHGLDDERSS